MTAPGGNDEVIRVVYQAVADYSQLIRETRRAREQAAALKRDIDALGGSTARVRVEADTSRARADLAGLIRNAVIRARVVLETTAARSELAGLVRDVIIKARVVVDAVAARAEIRAATRDATARVRVEADAAGLARLAAQLAQIRDLIVKVTVRADTAALAALRAQLARLRDLVVRVSVQADTAALGELRARLGRLRDLVVKVSIELGEVAATARVQALLAHLESLGPLVLAVVVDQSGLDAFEERLTRLRSEAGAGAGGGGGGGGGGDGGGGGGGGDESDESDAPSPVDAAKGVVSEGVSSASTAVTKFLGLGALAVPVAAAVIAAAGGIAAALLAAGAAAGIFAVAAVGALASVTKAVAAYEKSGTIAAGPLGEVVEQVEAVKDRYKELQKATENDVFAVFSRGLGIAVTLLDKIQDVIAPTAHAIEGALGQVQDAINGAGFDQFLSFVADEGPHAIAGFASGLLGFVGGLGRLIQAFKPFVSAFVDGFAAAGQAFDHWAAGLGDNKAFQDFITYGVQHIPDLVKLIVVLFTAAGNLIVALEPIGDVLLKLAIGAAAFIAAIPPGLLTPILAAVLALAVGIKVLQGAFAVGSAVKGFFTTLSLLPGKLSAAAAESRVLRFALLALGSTPVLLALTAAATVLSLLYARSQDAADAADRHRTAVQRLTASLQAYGTVETAQGRKDGLAEVNTDKIDLGAGEKGTNFTNLFSHVDTKTAAGYAKDAGVDVSTITNATLGNQKALDETLTKLKALQKKYLDESLATNPYDIAAQDNLQAQSNAVGKAIAAFEPYKEALGDATQGNADLNTAAGGAAGALTDAGSAAGGAAGQIDDSADAAHRAAGAYGTQAQAAAAVKGILSSTDFSSDAGVGKYDAAVSALSALDSATQSYTDALDAQKAAERQLKDATEATSAARLAAVQRIKDVQRALRDQALDERQLALNNKQAQEKLNEVIAHGGTADEIEQARIDAEQAANAKADFGQDKKPKKDALEAELAKGVEGNKALRDAIQNQKDASKALSTANGNVTKAADAVRDAKIAFNTAAGALKLTGDQLRNLKTRMDQLKSKTIDLVLNAKGAEAKLAALLQGQYAIQLLANNPDLSLADALAQAKALVPSVAAAQKTPLPAINSGNENPNVNPGGTGTGPNSGNLNPHVNPGRAEGGPLTPTTAVAGPVHGPGTGTSDSILARLPVGGAARLSRGEHIVTDAEVQRAPGGHGYLEAFRAGLRAGRPWAPAPGYRAGGPAMVPGPRVPVFALAGLPTALPGYAAGGAATAYRAGAGDTYLDRSVTVNVGTITNATPEAASDSLYKQVRKAVEGDF